MRVLAVLAAIPIFAAPPDLPPALRPVIETARAAPPEMFADVVARLAESGKIQQKDLQIELLSEAFRSAADAKETVRLIAIPSTPPDTRAIYRGKAGALGLDALSLQSRILKQLLSIDAPKARELFDQLVHPPPDAGACENPLLPDQSAYFEIAGAIAQQAFSAAEKSKDVHVQFLLTALSQAATPADLAAFARALESVQLKPAEFELLLASFSKTMEAMSAGYRSWAISSDALQSEVEALFTRASSAHIATDGLVKSYRKFLVTELTAPRCNDNLQGGQSALAWIAAHSTALTPDEMKIASLGGPVKADSYFQSTEAKQLGNELHQLTSSNRSAPEYPNRLADFLRDYSAWQPSGDDIDVFHQRATILTALLAMTPPGDTRDSVLEMTATLLQSSGAETASPAEWLWQLRTLLDAAGGDRGKLATTLQQSGDPALMLYAASN